MAIAAPTFPSPSTIQPARRYTPFELWHLLSLDAPSVAALWTVFFASAAHVRLPWIAPVAMATGVWVLYALDRILDGRSADAGRTHARQLRERHIFHARHERWFIAGSAILLPVVLLLCFRLVPPAVQRDMLLLSLAVAAYIAAIHLFSISAQRRVPKEMLVGVLFSSATVIPAWARAPLHHAPLLFGAALFATLSWLNCVAIETWESTPAHASQHIHPATLIAGRHLTVAACGLAAISTAAAAASAIIVPGSIAIPIAAACALAAGLLALLSIERRRLTPMALRIAADAALLSPLVILPRLLLAR